MKHRIHCEFRDKKLAEYSGTVRNPHTFMDDKVYVCAEHVHRLQEGTAEYLTPSERYWKDGKMEGA